MKKKVDISSVLIIGAGPIVIGQACEFDYSGTQACQALREEGLRVILVNSNPATIMTDPEMADATYIEPITPEVIEKIIEVEKPEALLSTVGGQTALNCGLELVRRGVLEKHHVKMIGANPQAIEKAENRQMFNEAMARIGLEVPCNAIVSSMEEAFKAIETIGLPAVIRPSFTLGGSGGGIADTMEEFQKVVSYGLEVSPTSQVLIDESIVGWKEYEMEVIRDKNDNAIIVCSIENVDPMGVHTGDSITVAPALTLTDKEYQIMRNASIAVLREIGVETGGANVQFAVNPKDGRLVVIEMNPRVSRSSALASKATGYPIARVAAKLAIGYTLDEVFFSKTPVFKPLASENPVSERLSSKTSFQKHSFSRPSSDSVSASSGEGNQAIPAAFEPSIDYVVTKIPRFNFEKFSDTQLLLSSSMRSVGEVMAIGRSFGESLQKGFCSMERGLTGLDTPLIEELERATEEEEKKQVLRDHLKQPTPDRLLVVAEALRQGLSLTEIYETTFIDSWFLREIQKIVEIESEIQERSVEPSRRPIESIEYLHYKKLGFSDARLAKLTGATEEQVRARRHQLGIRPVYKMVDTCAAEFGSSTSYLYSCYEGDHIVAPECESRPSDRKKVIILGSGPNRIGQGIEFDYTCVYGAKCLSEIGYETIMVNCNPETVSTDYDISDKLYFEPLNDEHVLELIAKEQQKGKLLGVIVQFGGQTPLKLSRALQAAQIPILGTSPDSIDLAEDREKFQKLLFHQGLRQPENSVCYKVEDIAPTIDKTVGYPVVVRPSNVLGGRAMEILRGESDLKEYLHKHRHVLMDGPILIDRFLKQAIEVDVDAICDGEEVFIAGIMEHVERAGIHSGDSACVLPAFSLSDKILSEIEESTVKLARVLDVVGLVNVQYAVKDEKLYVIEVNPRASRTTPFVAKATGFPVVKVASHIMVGKSLSDFNLPQGSPRHYSVKEVALPFARFPNADILLGPEMKSTGEAMGWDTHLDVAFAKAQLSVHNGLSRKGTAIVAYGQEDRDRGLGTAIQLKDLGFDVIFAGAMEKEVTQILGAKALSAVLEGEGLSLSEFMQLGKVKFVAFTGASRELKDFRCSLVSHRITYFSTHEAVVLAIKALPHARPESLTVRTLQSIECH